MKVIDLVIKREADNSHVLVAQLQDKSKQIKDVILDSKENPKELQPTYMLYKADDDSLQVDVLSQLQAMTHHW
ncbi:hypothetical protein KC480_05595 [Bacillus velezensis]|uniref:hypothetical protein n=1 Tax=Bacillus velezensis TaxID=492670 RepID=UPI001E3223F6|nr:hypothetical protein [Bacillus velezensis]MCD7910997.1 hypothetical protein [Bacillus velezensis]